MADVQGFYVTLTLDGTSITALCESVDLERTKAQLKKSTMDGSPGADYLAGEQTSTLTMAGFVNEDGQKGLEQSYEKDVEVPYSLFIGDTTDGLDAGTYTGNITLSRMTLRSSGEEVWRFELDGAGGLVVYTPPTP